MGINFKWVTGIKTLLIGVITPFIIGRNPFWMPHFSWTWMDFFPSPSEVTYKIQGGLRHVEFGAQLLCFNFYEIIIYQLLAKLDESTPTVLTKIQRNFHRISRHFVAKFRPYDFDFTTHVKLGSLGFYPVGWSGWKWQDESFPGNFLRQRWVGRTLLEATTLQWLN